MFTDFNGDVFEGMWSGHELDGKVTFASGGVYVGKLLHRNKHGYGVMTYPDGATYDGLWVDDKKHGPGKYTSADGKVLEGEWKEDTLFYENGTVLF